MDYWNKETLLIPQCETTGCLSHIEEIASMDGVDGIFIGPYGICLSDLAWEEELNNLILRLR